MKVVHALGWYFPESLGGTEIYVAALARGLVEAGHDVRIAAPDAAHDGGRTYTHDGVPVFRYSIPRQPTRAQAQGDAPVPGAEQLHDWLTEWRPDVFHVHTLTTGLDLAELRHAKRLGARIVVTSHTSRLGHLCQRGTLMRWGSELCDGFVEADKCAACILSNELPRPLARIVGAIPPSLGSIARQLPGPAGTALSMSDLIARNQARHHELLSLADHFVLLTNAACDIVVRNGAPRESLVINRLGSMHRGATPKPPRPTASPVRIGYLGRFESVKGVRVLADAFLRLPSDLPLRFELRGPSHTDDDRRMLVGLRALIGSDPRVTFAPPVPPGEVPAILAGYDVLCCPSLCLEGGPTVAIEAQAVGTPVIGSRIGGLPELVANAHEQLCTPGDVEQLADLLTKIALDPAATVDRWRTLIGPVRTMDDVVKDYLELYAS